MTCPVLDVGCGRGVVGEVFLRAGFDVWGVDFSQEALDESRRRGLKVLEGEATNLKLSRTFPLILCLEVLEHLADPLLALVNMAGHLDPGGLLILSLPNEFHLLRRMAMVFGFFPFEEHPQAHLHLFSPRKARDLIGEAKLTPVGFTAISLVPPRFPVLFREIGHWLAQASADLFSISTIWCLKKK